MVIRIVSGKRRPIQLHSAQATGSCIFVITYRPIGLLCV